MKKQKAADSSLDSIIDASKASGDLGPALTSDFSDALGLQDLKGSAGRPAAFTQGSAAPSAPAAPAPPIPQVDFSKLIGKMLLLVDAAASAALGIEKEDEATLSTSAECMTPWIQAHAGDIANETGLRLLAISGLVTYIAMKVIRWSEAQKNKPKPRPNVATATEDEHPQPVGIS